MTNLHKLLKEKLKDYNLLNIKLTGYESGVYYGYVTMIKNKDDINFNVGFICDKEHENISLTMSTNDIKKNYEKNNKKSKAH